MWCIAVYSILHMSDTEQIRMSVTFPAKLAAKIKAKADKKKWSLGQVVRDCVETVLTPTRKTKP